MLSVSRTLLNVLYVSSALHSWLNPMQSQSLSPMREFIEGTLSAAANKIINASNQSTVIDQFGIWAAKPQRMDIALNSLKLSITVCL